MPGVIKTNTQEKYTNPKKPLYTFKATGEGPPTLFFQHVIQFKYHETRSHHNHLQALYNAACFQFSIKNPCQDFQDFDKSYDTEILLFGHPG